MMAIRYGLYKAHYWTWSNSWEEFHVRSVWSCFPSFQYNIICLWVPFPGGTSLEEKQTLHPTFHPYKFCICHFQWIKETVLFLNSQVKDNSGCEFIKYSDLNNRSTYGLIGWLIDLLIMWQYFNMCHDIMTNSMLSRYQS